MELHPWVQYWIEQSNITENTERRVYMVGCVGMEIVFMNMFIFNKKIRKELVLQHSILSPPLYCIPSQIIILLFQKYF